MAVCRLVGKRVFKAGVLPDGSTQGCVAVRALGCRQPPLLAPTQVRVSCEQVTVQLRF